MPKDSEDRPNIPLQRSTGRTVQPRQAKPPTPPVRQQSAAEPSRPVKNPPPSQEPAIVFDRWEDDGISPPSIRADTPSMVSRLRRKNRGYAPITVCVAGVACMLCLIIGISIGRKLAADNVKRAEAKLIEARIDDAIASSERAIKESEEKVKGITEYLDRSESYIRTANETDWYKGGTLHKASLLEWKNASVRNRRATAADIIAAIEPHLNRVQLRVYTETLEGEISIIAMSPTISDEVLATEKVSETAAAIVADSNAKAERILDKLFRQK